MRFRRVFREDQLRWQSSPVRMATLGGHSSDRQVLLAVRHFIDSLTVSWRRHLRGSPQHWQCLTNCTRPLYSSRPVLATCQIAIWQQTTLNYRLINSSLAANFITTADIKTVQIFWIVHDVIRPSRDLFLTSRAADVDVVDVAWLEWVLSLSQICSKQAKFMHRQRDARGGKSVPAWARAMTNTTLIILTNRCL